VMHELVTVDFRNIQGQVLSRSWLELKVA